MPGENRLTARLTTGAGYGVIYYGRTHINMGPATGAGYGVKYYGRTHIDMGPAIGAGYGVIYYVSRCGLAVRR